jgi:hypothetical protein
MDVTLFLFTFEKRNKKRNSFSLEIPMRKQGTKSKNETYEE